MPDVSIDGVAVSVDAGATLLDACRARGVDVPTLCFGETLHPKNACRVCVVELEGSRVLVPACSRIAEDGMTTPPLLATSSARAGLANPIAPTTRAKRRSSAGRWRRHPGRSGATLSSRSTLVNFTAYERLRRCITRYAITIAIGMMRSHSRCGASNESEPISGALQRQRRDGACAVRQRSERDRRPSRGPCAARGDRHRLR